jgi:hypothetical protein
VSGIFTMVITRTNLETISHKYTLQRLGKVYEWANDEHYMNYNDKKN